MLPGPFDLVWFYSFNGRFLTSSYRPPIGTLASNVCNALDTFTYDTIVTATTVVSVATIALWYADARAYDQPVRKEHYRLI